jgi:hypothetical protein
MRSSTFRTLAVRSSVLCAVALSACLIELPSIQAQSPLDINLSESLIVPPPPEVGISQLPGFSWAKQFELQLTGPQSDPVLLSDEIFLYNAGANAANPGTATVVFLSDDERGILPPFPTSLPQPGGLINVLVLPEPGPNSIPGLALTNNITGISFFVPNSFFSDVDNGAFNQLSDFAHFVTPEPSAIGMAGVGLIAFAAMAYRRRRSRRGAIGLLVILLACASAKTAFAQAPGTPLPGTPGFTLTFDERGNTLLNGGPNPNQVVLIGGGGIDIYLPSPVVPGDVLVFNPNDQSPLAGGHSDLLTFFNLNNAVGQTGVLYFQSLIDETTGPDDPADVSSFPTTSQFVVQEFGPEGNNKFLWVPDPTNPFGAAYNGYSDGVLPEPSTFVLGGLALLGLAAVAYRRRRLASI